MIKHSVAGRMRRWSDVAELLHPPVSHDRSGSPPTDPPLRPSNLSIGIAAVFVVGISTAWTIGLPALGVEIPPTTAEFVHGAANTLLQVVAALALFRGARLLSGRRRVAWLLITLGPAIGAISAAIWTISVARTGHHPQHPFVDLLFLASLAATTIGVATLPPTPQRSRRIRWVDSAIVMLAAVSVVWVTPVSPGSITEVATITLVGATTVVSIAVALGSLARCRPDQHGEVVLITGGLVAAGFGVLLYLSAGDQYPMTARLGDTLFIVSFVLAGAAGLRLASPPAAQRRRGTDRRGRWIALPEVATLVTLTAISLHEHFHDDGSLAVSFAVGLIAVGLALLRLGQLGKEQRHLSQLLHDSADRLYREARTDNLTGLGNRLALEEHLATRLARRARRPEAERSTLTVLFIDVDHFKRFNDALGHAVGDGLLGQVALRITEAVGARGYRIGGDEFVAVVEGLTPQQTTSLAERVVASFDAPVVVGDHEMSCSISVGVAESDPDDDATAETVLRRADLALYRAKELGRAGWCAYSAALQRRAEHRTQLRQGLRRAAGLGELEVRFQPMADLRTHATVGVTASLSWDSPDHGVMRRDDVAVIAAEGGLLGATIGVLFGEIRRTLHLTSPSGDGHAVPLWVGTRLTLAELLHPATTELIIATVADPGIDPARLHVDITEDTVVDDAALEVIAGVRQLGVHVTVDRFGTGPSSLLRLSHYPATTIRVDGSFVEGVGRRRDDTAILTAVSGLASDLHLELSADGIDEEFQSTYLEGLGFSTGSGRLFGEAALRSEMFDDHGRLRSSTRSLAPGLAR
jgi:diguanylate cyclase (GGDEF)-like protein